MTKIKMILVLFLRCPSTSSKSSTERLIVDSFRSACLLVECMNAIKKPLAKITLQWSSVSSFCPIASCSVGYFINFYFTIPRSQRLWNRKNGCIVKKKENGRRTGFWVRLHPTLFFHADIRDSRKYDTFREKQAVLFLNLLGNGFTQEIK